MKTVHIGAFDVNNSSPFFLMAGPCVLESRDHAYECAGL